MREEILAVVSLPTGGNDNLRFGEAQCKLKIVLEEVSTIVMVSEMFI